MSVIACDVIVGLGKRPLVWDQESGSNPVARLRRRPCSLVLGLAASSQVTEVVRVHLGGIFTFLYDVIVCDYD